jgi:hypothetical protein
MFAKTQHFLAAVNAQMRKSGVQEVLKAVFVHNINPSVFSPAGACAI